MTMHCEEASALPILDQSWLFLPLSTDPQNPNRRYLQCPATGHVYCLSTGSLFCNTSQMNPLTTSISSPDQRKASCSSFSKSVSCMMKKSVNTKNTDQPVQSNGTSTTPKSGINKSPNSKNAGQSVQGNRTSITQSNKAPNVKSASQHIHSGASITSNTQSNKAPTAKHGDQCIQGSNASTQKNQSKTSSNVTSISDPTTKKQKKKQRKTKTEKALKKHCRTTQDESVHAQEHLYASSKKNSQQLSKNETKKQNKLTVLPKSKPITSFINSPSNIKYSTLITRIITPASPAKGNPVIKKQSKTHNESSYNPFLNTKIKSFRYYNLNLQPLSKTKPFEINLDDLLFLQNISPSIAVKDVCQKSHTELQACLSFRSINKCSSKPAEKPSLYLSRKDHDMMDLESNFRKKTAERKTFLKRSYNFNSTWKILKPFNRRPHYHCCWKQRSLQDQYKNCIMASSVHEIIHSRFAKNTDEKMPVSQIRAMLSSGVRKLRRRQRWIQLMEEEAINKYKEQNHKLNLVVENYDVLHHLEKSWLVSYGRWVMDKRNEESWPLLVKCLHKYPDSTLQRASKHRSSCLRWNGTSYTLRMDHAYYTQIQCHMAVTDAPYAELIVHTHKEIAILPVYFDFDFWKQTEETLETFFTNNILPYLKKVQS